MTDDPGTDSPPEDPRIEALTRASHSIHVAPLDTAQFVRAARVRRRRRRTIISSVLASAVIVAGVSVATAGSSSPSQNTNLDAADQSDAVDETKELGVTVEHLYPRTRDFEIQEGAADWDPQTRTLAYVTSTFEGGCLADGAASLRGSSASLVLTESRRLQVCRRSSETAIVTINGLTEAPTELTVTESGQTRTVPVEREREPSPSDGLDALDCPSGEISGTPGGLLAQLPDGYDTQEEAVEAWLQGTKYEGQRYRLSEDGESAFVLRDDGTVEAMLGFIVNSGYTVHSVFNCV